MSEFVSVTALLTPYQAYQVEKWHKQNLGGYKTENLNIRKECFQKFPDWQLPTPEEIRVLLEFSKMTQKQASEYLGLRDTDGRSFRRFVNGDSKIPYSYWVLLCMYVGIDRFW